MDIFGPVAYVSIGGNKYGFVIVDDYSRYTWVFFMKDKSKVHEIFKKFTTRAQNEFDVKIKRVRSDNGTEFKNTNIEEYLDEEGIGHELSIPYTPQQNGIVERKNRTLIEAARTMLDEYKTSDSFWAEVINTASHAINRLYLHKLRHKTAYELLIGKKPNVSSLEFLVISASFSTRSPKALSLLLKLMKVSFLVMPQTFMAIVSSTKPPVVLKSRVT
jgi:transposase InsO family protein